MNPLNPFRRRGTGEHRRLIRMVPDSPLRRIDPRVKLGVCILVALSVMLPLERLAVFWLIFAVGIVAARLTKEMLYQVRRIAFILVLLFILDWVGVGLTFAVLITLRFVLVVSAFTLFFATTTPEEFRLAMEHLRMPYAYAFSLSLAFLSISLMQEEFLNILEAQRSRGAWQDVRGLRRVGDQLSGLVALGVPAIVLTVKRAWTYTEAAHTRGFDSPRRRPYRQLALQSADGILLLAALAITGVVFFWR
ncbi:MAG: energy-coupling factor transporter transmembrane protein EcfT [Chloroflexi bacterium]|nr:energy-coupling factor transporter transmembrane protein EcfT [Chloroflexota bacterium]MCL5950594.1 energy-coupling factor transporter transmembrane protein EcfT [Chloroflexota bacterium]